MFCSRLQEQHIFSKRNRLVSSAGHSGLSVPGRERVAGAAAWSTGVAATPLPTHFGPQPVVQVADAASSEDAADAQRAEELPARGGKSFTLH